MRRGQRKRQRETQREERGEAVVNIGHASVYGSPCSATNWSSPSP